MIPAPTSAAAICAVITTYQPGEGFFSRVARVGDQVGLTVIVDDSARAENVHLLQEGLTGATRVLVLHHAENRGVAAALNSGIAVARERGYSWVLTLDDDTLIHRAMVEYLVDAWRKHARTTAKPIALMGMGHAHEGELDAANLDGAPRCIEKRGIITSGSLIALDAYGRIGRFREEFFIDGVDYDYCLRARANGYRVVQVCQVGMIHRLGDSRRHGFGPFTWETTNHDATRRYYAVRNSTVLVREHTRRDPAYAAAVVAFQLKTLLLVLLWESDKRAKVMGMARGFLDGWRNRLGKRADLPRAQAGQAGP